MTSTAWDAELPLKEMLALSKLSHWCVWKAGLGAAQLNFFNQTIAFQQLHNSTVFMHVSM